MPSNKINPYAVVVGEETLGVVGVGEVTDIRL